MNVLTTVSKMALRLSSLQRTWIWEVHRKAAASCGEWRKAWKCPVSGHLARVKWLRSGSRYEKQSEDLESELLSHSSAWSLAPSPQCLWTPHSVLHHHSLKLMDIYLVSMSVSLWKILMPPERKAGSLPSFLKGLPLKTSAKSIKFMRILLTEKNFRTSDCIQRGLPNW